MDFDFYFNKGIALYDKGFYLKNREDILSIIEALKNFIAANKLNNNLYAKPKVLR
jgi:hypothetical protein